MGLGPILRLQKLLLKQEGSGRWRTTDIRIFKHINIVRSDQGQCYCLAIWHLFFLLTTLAGLILEWGRLLESDPAARDLPVHLANIEPA